MNLFYRLCRTAAFASLLSGTVALSLFFTSCSKDDGDKPVLNEPIADILGGNYWDEMLYLVYEEGGETHMFAVVQGDSFYNPWLGGDPEWNVMLGYPQIIAPFERKMIFPIYVEKESSNLTEGKYPIRFFAYSEKDKQWHFDIQYAITYDSGNRFVKIIAANPDLLLKNAVAGSEMKILSATSDEVVFEAPLKDYTCYVWALNGYGAIEDSRHYTGLRVVWTKSPRAALYKDATQLALPKNHLNLNE